MAFYNGLFDGLGLRDWCNAGASHGPMSMAELLKRAKEANDTSGPSLVDAPFPSLDALHDACQAIPRTRDLTSGIESTFLYLRVGLKRVLDPVTQPLSWLLDFSLRVVDVVPWWVLVIALLVIVYLASRSWPILGLVTVSLLALGFVDHLHYALQTMVIVFACTLICIVIGIPVGVVMSKSKHMERFTLPILDMLQTLPSFVYLIPLIFLFSVTESKLYGIAIILYAVVPVIRLTNLGVRMVDGNVGEAADAFGLDPWQKLIKVELPLALPSIMAGVNQTIMMSLSMVVIASLVSAPGLGVLVLRGINNLELGVGLVAGFGIVLLAINFDRVSKASMSRVNSTLQHRGGGH
ncbi:ABC transporter permease [Rhizobium mesoamericanum]|uniref:Glycine betaine transporter subunit membrane component of ABC superfamily n=1 Tax=Rhizobium mesoamericanum STM3625 TaxID=1211777 RepID=K0Q3C1_9HYPH|nr:ABC transporter permease subunit [Rhizobium mesoamericanum]CCM78802.1 glycine betaine transporter subunit; membrane component of ABC superfamily [Rhizobium mesoamericanum STM3625]